MVKISIITTTFNAAGTVRDCLESVVGQTHPDVEHIVVDGASTDGTLEILAEYRGSLARVLSASDRGIYDGMNRGLALATGDVVGILNADDVYASAEILEKVSQVFEDPQIDSCYGDLVYVADEGIRHTVKGSGEKKNNKDFRVVRYWRSRKFNPEKFYWGWMPPHPTFFVRRRVYERYGYFNLDLGTAADYELMLRFLVKHHISCAYIPEVLIAMRSGGASNATLKARLQANRMDREAWAVNGLKPYPWTMMLKPLRKLGQWVVRPR